MPALKKKSAVKLAEFVKFYTVKLEELKKDEGGVNSAPISGNIYMYKTLADFGYSTGILQPTKEGEQTGITPFVTVALYIIIIVQLFAPLCLIVSSVHAIHFGADGSLFGGYIGVQHFIEYEFGSDEIGISHMMQRVLGLLFIVLFCMNGLHVLDKDQIETEKVAEMSFLFKEVIRADEETRKMPIERFDRGCSPWGLFNTALAAQEDELQEDQAMIPPDIQIPPPKEYWLWIGAFLNSLCLFSCCVAMVFMFVVEEGPKDLVLDSFGLAFLYNLDDLGGEMAFMDEAWDGEFIGRIYGAMLADVGMMEEARQKRLETCSADNVYTWSKRGMKVLMVLLPLMYLFLEMSPKDQQGGGASAGVDSSGFAYQPQGFVGVASMPPYMPP